MPVVADIAVSRSELEQFGRQPHAILVDDAVFRLEGAGAVDCLQGLLTNDVKRATPGHGVWGAILTPKGMIISDGWVLCDEAGAWLLVPGRAHDTVQQLLLRTIPPRLARVTDRTGDMRAWWLLGDAPPKKDEKGLFRPVSVAPFVALRLAAPRATDAGGAWPTAPAVFADLAKLRLGWPTLGREIDEKTLPQEVRFDELDGVRYDKGCYTGQETVARLHFRGHANRVLRGVVWAPGDSPSGRDVTDGEKLIGTLRTIARVGERFAALAVLRREIGPGDTVRTGESEGVVIEPPFDGIDVTAA